MLSLNFPAYTFRVKNSQNKRLIFDVLRKKFVLLTPEEWVRQHVVHYLMGAKKYPKNLMNVEKQLTVCGIKKRYDIVVFNTDGSLLLLVECKAPEHKITQTVFDQIAVYNKSLQAKYLMVTNGLQHYYCQLPETAENYTFLTDIPEFSR